MPTAVPFLVVFLVDHPRPTRRQGSGGDRHLKIYEPRDNLPQHAEQLIATLAAAARPRVAWLAPARYSQAALRGEATIVAAATTEQFIAALEPPRQSRSSTTV
jgi:hypothetical protein